MTDYQLYILNKEPLNKAPVKNERSVISFENNTPYRL